EQDTATLRTDLHQAEEALAEARKVAELSTGRFSVPRDALWINSWLDIAQGDLREPLSLLGLDALLRAQQDDIDGALVSCRAMLNAARSLGDALNLLTLQARCGCTRIALQSTERVLAQGEAKSDAPLAALQRVL